MAHPDDEPTALHAALDERGAERLPSAPFAVSEVLAIADTLVEATPKILEAICRSLSWDLGQLWRIDAENGLLRYVAGWRQPDADVEPFEAISRETTFERGIGLPGRVWATAKPAWIRDVVRDLNFPRAPVAARVGLHGAFGFPILVGSEVLGVMEFFTRELRELDADLLGMMGSVGGQLGQFMARKQVEEASLAEAEESRRRLAFLAEASRILSASLDYEKTLSKLARLVVPEIADWCVVDVIEEDGSVKALAVSHVDPEKVNLAKELRERWPVVRHDPEGVAKVIRTGRSQLLEEISDTFLETTARDPEHLAMIRRLGLTAAMIVPLVARGRSLGTISFLSSSGGRLYGQEDLFFAEDVAARAAVAIDNARLYGERSRIARTLQRSLLPPKLPVIAGLDISARYLPAGEANEVGGDFYDVFAVAKRSWVVAIGDVQGKGPEAATVTGLARHTLRVATMQRRSPSEILQVLNEALLRDESDRFLTAAVGIMRFTKLGATITVACGGHPPPLLRKNDGTVLEVGAPGTLLGVFPDPVLTDEEVRLRPGDTLMFYTDGLTSERAPGGGMGVSALASVLETCVDLDADQTSRRILDAVEAHRPGPPPDDIALLVFRVIP